MSIKRQFSSVTATLKTEAAFQCYPLPSNKINREYETQEITLIISWNFQRVMPYFRSVLPNSWVQFAFQNISFDSGITTKNEKAYSKCWLLKFYAYTEFNRWVIYQKKGRFWNRVLAKILYEAKEEALNRKCKTCVGIFGKFSDNKQN